MGAVKTATSIGDAKQGTFGSGLKYTYSPQSGALIYCRMQRVFRQLSLNIIQKPFITEIGYLSVLFLQLNLKTADISCDPPVAFVSLEIVIS